MSTNWGSWCRIGAKRERMGGVGHKSNWGGDGGDAVADSVPVGGSDEGEHVRCDGRREGRRDFGAGHGERQLHKYEGGDQRGRDDHLHDGGAKGQRLADHEPCVERGAECGPVDPGGRIARLDRRQRPEHGDHQPRHQSGQHQHPAPQPEAQKRKPTSAQLFMLRPCNNATICVRSNMLPVTLYSVSSKNVYDLRVST